MQKKKYMIRIKTINQIIIFASLFAATSFASAKSLKLSEIEAKPIPPGYNFPTQEATINKWIAASDTTAIRDHAWDLWSGLTGDSGEIYDNKSLPIWETWYGSPDVFPNQKRLNVSAKTAAAFLASHRGPLHFFVQPHQFTHVKSGLSLQQVLGPPETRLLSFNKFNPQTAAFIISPQTGPGGQTYHYNLTSSLIDLNNAWPTGTSGQDRAINSFPRESMVLKPLFGIVKATGLTAIPVWRGLAGSTQPSSPSLSTWTTCALVDPQGKDDQIRPATQSEIDRADKGGFSCKTFLYAPLSTLYSIKLSSPEAARFSQLKKSGVDTGSYAVLLALHVNTHEIPFWAWQTFYWQPGEDTPNNFPGSKAGQPKGLKSPWNNYAMCTNYSQTTTPGGTTMNVCFNPYIETSPGIPEGINSNCMSCHGVARFTVNPDDAVYPNNYKAPIPFFTDPKYYNSISTNAAFSWAIAGTAIAPPPSPPQ